MTDIKLLINGRESDIGDGFIVRRLLPYPQQRMVGPFIFWDHIGPVAMHPKFRLAVRAHPHIGLSTLTYLFSGEMLHRDSLGNEMTIKPGAVNWMTAGKGIAHSERAEYNRTIDKIEGIQLWVALPKEYEEVEPSFQHVAKSDLPFIKSGDLNFTLIAGTYAGESSPVQVYSDLFYLSAIGKKSQKFTLHFPVHNEVAVYVASGKIKLNNEDVEAGQLAILNIGAQPIGQFIEDGQVLVFGGKPYAEKRHIWWNFVATDREMIEQAKLKWKDGRFAPVLNEEEFIPLPEK